MKRFRLLCAIWTALAAWSGCSAPPRDYRPQDLAEAWGRMTLYLLRATPSNSPTFASRTLGYIGVAQYEAVVHGAPGWRSLAGQLNGLDSLPAPEPGTAYDWNVAYNAAHAEILRSLYIQAPDTSRRRIDSLEGLMHRYFTARSGDTALAARSAAYGRAVAGAVFDWSQHDGGHRGYLRNFDKTFTGPLRPGSWRPPLYAQSFSHHPLHPYWGQNRTFLAANSALPVPPMIPYDTARQSAYYQQYLQVYEKERSLTQEEKEIALWWGDDPGETFTPAGHSYYLATAALRKTQPELIVWAGTYARVGMAVADAFILCWRWKYHYFSERPNTFIPQHIDPQWESFWPDPPFPAFPSGHAIQSAAAAVVLEDVFGKSFAFTDSAHAGRKRDALRDTDFKPRRFSSFWEVAVETANSRFYGGIHTPQDNQAGQDAGVAIGRQVNGLRWRE
ncbi:MAG: vanadium-dependent haloperoxidase [Bacteroidia bacterium]|nr:vanadium-dependent haloperoxidase [Bacteroidia bacterium]